MLRPPRCILLDLDGTLCDTDASVQAGVDGACAEAERLLGVDESAWRAANSEAAAAVWSANAQRWVDGQLTSLDLSTQIYARTLVAVDQDPVLAPDFVDAHAAASSVGLKPYADVRPFLDAASAAGIPLALVTNGASDTQRKTLATIGLAEQFDAIVVSGEEGVSKPDPAIFDLALRQLGIAAVDGWHIGDSLPSDVAGALGVGLGAVWINRDGRKRQAADPVPTEEIARLTDVLGVLG